VAVTAGGGTIPAAIAEEDRAGKVVRFGGLKPHKAPFGAARNLDSTSRGRALFSFLREQTMPDRGPQTFKKRHEEQQPKERQQEKWSRGSRVKMSGHGVF
jgi:hypothetical protein